MKVWKIALGVALGLFLVMGACAAIIAGGASKAKTSLDKRPAVVRVEADAKTCWSGSIGDATRDGCGPARFDVQTNFGRVVSANVQKKGADAQALAIIVEIDGKEVARNSTSAAYGVAQVTSS